MKKIWLIGFVVLFSAELFAFPIYLSRDKELSEDYYPNGTLKNRMVTYTYGKKKSNLGVFGKTKVKVWEYYENGKQELVQKSVEKTASTKQNKNTGEPMNKLPRIKRRYYRYDRAGKLIEKGWETSRRSKNVVYDVEIYSKVITKKNQLWRNPKIKRYTKDKKMNKIKMNFMDKTGQTGK